MANANTHEDNLKYENRLRLQVPNTSTYLPIPTISGENTKKKIIGTIVLAVAQRRAC